MSWQSELKGNPLSWLLEESDPAVRSLALRDLLDLPAGDAQLEAARRAAHAAGAIPDVLDEMKPAGYWVKPGPGYNPKYRSAVWSLTMLAQMGADAACDERIAHACAYAIEHALAAGGKFSYNGAPSGTVDCLQGNLCFALWSLGCRDERLEQAFAWMARTVTGEGLASNDHPEAAERYYAYKCGPNFACGANGKLPCGWGAVKIMRAFGSLPAGKRTPLIERAIQQGIDFLFSVDPASARYPTRSNARPNASWWKLGFPVFYVTDFLQVLEALAALGCGQDPRLANALTIIREKQGPDGRWLLEYDLTGKTWPVIGEYGQPNKWVTLRALRVLKAAAKE